MFLLESAGLSTSKGDGRLSSLPMNNSLIHRDETIRPIGCRAVLMGLHLNSSSHLGCLELYIISITVVANERSALTAERRGAFIADWYPGDLSLSCRI